MVTGILIFAFVGFCLYKMSTSPSAVAAREEAAKQQAQIICPHCQTRGSVTARQVTRKKGISGGKATGAVLTGGVSMLATGLSRKESARRLSCSSCGMQWDV
jgi:hypothetical protein